VTQGPDLTQRQSRVVVVTSSLLGVAATLVARGLLFRPNRVMDGEAASLLEGLGAWGWALIGLWAIAAIAATIPLPCRVRGWLMGLSAGAAPIMLMWRAGLAADAYSATAGEFSRTSLGAGVWLTFLAAYMCIFAATAWMDPGVARAVVSYLPILGIAALLGSGHLADLSIMREYANNAEDFWMELRLHLGYVVTSVVAGLTIGIACGLLAAKRPSTEPAVFGTLNVFEVMPTLAFIGLLNPVLTALSDRFTLVQGLGIRGVGWAPVIIVLTTYAVYPIARNTYTAIVTLDPGVMDAATGVGMGRVRRLFEVELPLAAPVMVAGLRIALVQTTAAAIIAGLVGGGGLGTFVFLGASETATDLILLGTIPIVSLALAFDRAALAAQHALGLEAREA